MATVAVFGDLATSLSGMTIGLRESNPLNTLLGFQQFALWGLLVQIAGSILLSYAWMKSNRNWRVGYLVAASPRLTAALLNAYKILAVALL